MSWRRPEVLVPLQKSNIANWVSLACKKQYIWNILEQVPAPFLQTGMVMVCGMPKPLNSAITTTGHGTYRNAPSWNPLLQCLGGRKFPREVIRKSKSTMDHPCKTSHFLWSTGLPGCKKHIFIQILGTS